MRCLDPRTLWVSISRKAELDGALFGLTGSGWSKQDEFDLSAHLGLNCGILSVKLVVAITIFLLERSFDVELFKFVTL